MQTTALSGIEAIVNDEDPAPYMAEFALRRSSSGRPHGCPLPPERRP